ncbi:MAG: hypothetical protein EA385_03350 [Salinarimonadaceae bacterium]|nr:MAG: hypothetical protein EA385_03350 [Salinarimonadaceae bacterium]
MQPMEENSVSSGRGAGVLRRLRSFPFAASGIAAVEFALILPVLLLLYLGMAEVTTGVNINRKMTILSRTLADLTSRSAGGVNNAEMDSIFGASTTVMTPYDTSNLQMRVSSVVITTQGGNPQARVCWSDGRNMPARAVNEVMDIPAGFDIPNTSFILAEVSNTHTPMLGYAITGSLSLNETTPWPVRNVAEISRNGSTCL